MTVSQIGNYIRLPIELAGKVLVFAIRHWIITLLIILAIFLYPHIRNALREESKSEKETQSVSSLSDSSQTQKETFK